MASVPDFPVTVDQRLMPEGDHHPLGQVVGRCGCTVGPAGYTGSCTEQSWAGAELVQTPALAWMSDPHLLLYHLKSNSPYQREHWKQILFICFFPKKPCLIRMSIPCVHVCWILLRGLFLPSIISLFLHLQTNWPQLKFAQFICKWNKGKHFSIYSIFWFTTFLTLTMEETSWVYVLGLLSSFSPWWAAC